MSKHFCAWGPCVWWSLSPNNFNGNNANVWNVNSGNLNNNNVNNNNGLRPANFSYKCQFGKYTVELVAMSIDNGGRLHDRETSMFL